MSRLVPPRAAAFPVFCSQAQRGDMGWRRHLGTTIQIGPYPPLTVTRTPKGGWRLENTYVIFLDRVTLRQEVDTHYG